MWWVLAAFAQGKPEGELPCVEPCAAAPTCRDTAAILAAIKPFTGALAACRTPGARLTRAGPSISIHADGTASATAGTGISRDDLCATKALSELRLSAESCELILSWPTR